jgi:hypothetical protein
MSTVHELILVVKRGSADFVLFKVCGSYYGQHPILVNMRIARQGKSRRVSGRRDSALPSYAEIRACGHRTGPRRVFNLRLTYVSVSRGRYDAQISTSDEQKPGEALSRDVLKPAALEAEP